MSIYVRSYEGYDPYLFVSYSHKDSEKVIPVIQELYRKKIRVWYDEGIAPGSEWPYMIEKHLKQSAAVLVFVSQNSLGSPNCENEVVVACEQHKRMIQVCLDPLSTHPLLSGRETLEPDENLISRICSLVGDAFTGDGVTGYQYSIDRKIRFNVWNILLGFAAVLAIVLSGALYALYNGMFDSILPARQTEATSTPEPSKAETVDIGKQLIGNILPVQFSSDEERNAVYALLEWDQNTEMTYQDLLAMEEITYLDIGKETMKDISFATFLPNLEILTFHDSQIRDLSPLVNCQKLKTVQVTVDMLPLTIPTSRDFEIEIID